MIESSNIQKRTMNGEKGEKGRNMEKSPVSYEIRVGSQEVQTEALYSMLKDTYWAKERSEAHIKKSLEQSICVSALEQSEYRQIGFVRAITDYATVYYVLDLVVAPEFRNKGAGRKLMEALIGQPQLKDLRGILITQNPVAQHLYEKLGFLVCQTTFMEKTGNK